MNSHCTAPPHSPTSPRAVATIALLSFALGGCPTDPELVPPVVNGYTDPAALVAAHAAALDGQNYAAYDKLLADDFEYFPQSMDLVDFPWLQGRISWNKADELQMIGHMFDDNFHPADPTAGTVDTIDAQLTVDGQQSQPDGSVVVGAHAVMTVIYVGGLYGARADVRFELRLVTGADGYLRIREIRELPPYQRAVEPENWGSIKSLYR